MLALNRYLGRATVVLWIAHLIFINQISAITYGYLQVLLLSLDNPRGLSWSGDPCQVSPASSSHSSPAQSSSSSFPPSSQSSQNVCRIFLRFCFTNYVTDPTQDFSQCSFGEAVSPVLTDAASGRGSLWFRNQSSPNEDVLSSQVTSGFTNPAMFPIDFSWPGKFSLLVQAYNDLTSNGPSQGSPRELIGSFLVSNDSVKPGGLWGFISSAYRTKNGQNISLSLQYRVRCSENYYGDQCTTLCRARDDELGHYKCSGEGKIVCLPGWTGGFCSQRLCNPACVNGVCSDMNICGCFAGWRGAACDVCKVGPGCNANNAFCDTPGECKCNYGWTGPTCDQVVAGPNCSQFNPCKNGGSCVEELVDTSSLLKGVRCQCPEGFRGIHCEERTCGQTVCSNGGTCRDDNGTVVCLCSLGFTGSLCESVVSITTSHYDNSSLAIVPASSTATVGIIAGAVAGAMALTFILICIVAILWVKYRRGDVIAAEDDVTIRPPSFDNELNDVRVLNNFGAVNHLRSHDDDNEDEDDPKCKAKLKRGDKTNNEAAGKKSVEDAIRYEREASSSAEGISTIAAEYRNMTCVSDIIYNSKRYNKNLCRLNNQLRVVRGDMKTKENNRTSSKEPNRARVEERVKSVEKITKSGIDKSSGDNKCKAGEDKMYLESAKHLDSVEYSRCNEGEDRYAEKVDFRKSKQIQEDYEDSGINSLGRGGNSFEPKFNNIELACSREVQNDLDRNSVANLPEHSLRKSPISDYSEYDNNYSEYDNNYSNHIRQASDVYYSPRDETGSVQHSPVRTGTAYKSPEKSHLNDSSSELLRKKQNSPNRYLTLDSNEEYSSNRSSVDSSVALQFDYGNQTKEKCDRFCGDGNIHKIDRVREVPQSLNSRKSVYNERQIPLNANLQADECNLSGELSHRTPCSNNAVHSDSTAVNFKTDSRRLGSGASKNNLPTNSGVLYSNSEDSVLNCEASPNESVYVVNSSLYATPILYATLDNNIAADFNKVNVRNSPGEMCDSPERLEPFSSTSSSWPGHSNVV